MRKKAALAGVLVAALLLFGCEDAGAGGGFQARLLAAAAPLAEEAGSPRALTLDSVRYGSFSSPDAAELCALFKYDAPAHAEGLDRTLAVVCAADDLEVVASIDLMADSVRLAFLPAGDGTQRVLYLGASTYQGITSRTQGLYRVSVGAWEPLESGLPALDGFREVYLAEETVLCVGQDGASAAYNWNAAAECFLPAPAGDAPTRAAAPA